jgi:hypothetical protein
MELHSWSVKPYEELVEKDSWRRTGKVKRKRFFRGALAEACKAMVQTQLKYT